MDLFRNTGEPGCCKSIVVLGSTGSIGSNTLDVVARFPDRFRVAGLTAWSNVERLLEQIRRFRPERVAVGGRPQAEWLEARVPEGVRVVHGEEGYLELAGMEDVDLVVSAMVGAAGLKPTLHAIRSGTSVALANKETLVMAGELVVREARKRGVPLLPIDSEHSAILQCIMGQEQGAVRRILLTASGGPFLNTPLPDLDRIRPSDALAHPTWEMGPKITIDSSTLMNKGLEAIEAHWFFDVPIEAVDIHIHPQSVVHSLVEFRDGSVIGQLGIPDMRIPIAFALSYPQRLDLGLPALNLFEIGRLTFERPDLERFPCLALALEAGRVGGTMTAVLNAANEVAVSLFLESRIRYPEIARIVRETMDRHDPVPVQRLFDVLEADRWARETARRIAFRKGR